MSTFFEIGERVFFQHPEESWVLGRVVESDESTGQRFYTCTTTSEDGEVDGKFNATGLSPSSIAKFVDGTLRDFEDLMTMPYLHDSVLLYHIRKTYFDDLVYNRIGPIVLAVNPFNYDIPHYSESLMPLYMAHGTQHSLSAIHASAGTVHLTAAAAAAVAAAASAKQEGGTCELPLASFPHPVPTHPWSVAHRAYCAMRCEGVAQSILVSGESGAGKTEACKSAASYLAAVSSATATTTAKARAADAALRLISSSPILEAFGNAKTVRNDNSSRFGQYLRLQFDRAGVLTCTHITPYLLEKSRVVSHGDGERSYHVFYQLVEGVSDGRRQELRLGRPARGGVLDPRTQWLYGGVPAPTIDAIAEDVKGYAEGVKAFELLGFSGRDVDAVERSVAFVILLHAVEIAEVDDGRSCITDASVDILRDAAVVVGLEAQDLEREILSTTTVTRGESITRNHTAAQACGAKDALCKTVYERLFERVVEGVNAGLRGSGGGDRYTVAHEVEGQDLLTVTADGGVCEPSSTRAAAVRQRWVGLLDIFGFESFETNSFEQLCINYANETLQHHYNDCVFARDAEEYEREGVDVTHVVAPDNSATLALIDSKVRHEPGLLSLLNDACAARNGSDEGFLDEAAARFAKHPAFEKGRLMRGCFKVKHYAGIVTYSTSGWRAKNIGALKEGLAGVVRASSNAFVAALLPAAPEAGARLRATATVASTFSASMRALMTTIYSTNPHWIRCIKPHDQKKPRMFDGVKVMEQMRSAGVLETVEIRKAGYAIRVPHLDFYRRYRCVLSLSAAASIAQCRVSDDAAAASAAASSIVAAVGLCDRAAELQVGATKVYMRDSALAALEGRRSVALAGEATLLQSVACAWRSGWRTQCLRLVWKVVRIQKFGWAARSYGEVGVRQQLARVRVIQCEARALLSLRLLYRVRLLANIRTVQAAAWSYCSFRALAVQQQRRHGGVVVCAVRCVVSRRHASRRAARAPMNVLCTQVYGRAAVSALFVQRLRRERVRGLDAAVRVVGAEALSYASRAVVKVRRAAVWGSLAGEATVVQSAARSVFAVMSACRLRCAVSAKTVQRWCRSAVSQSVCYTMQVRRLTAHARTVNVAVRSKISWLFAVSRLAACGEGLVNAPPPLSEDEQVVSDADVIKALCSDAQKVAEALKSPEAAAALLNGFAAAGVDVNVFRSHLVQLRTVERERDHLHRMNCLLQRDASAAAFADGGGVAEEGGGSESRRAARVACEKCVDDEDDGNEMQLDGLEEGVVRAPAGEGGEDAAFVAVRPRAADLGRARRALDVGIACLSGSGDAPEALREGGVVGMGSAAASVGRAQSLSPAARDGTAAAPSASQRSRGVILRPVLTEDGSVDQDAWADLSRLRGTALAAALLPRFESLRDAVATAEEKAAAEDADVGTGDVSLGVEPLLGLVRGVSGLHARFVDAVAGVGGTYDPVTGMVSDGVGWCGDPSANDDATTAERGGRVGEGVAGEDGGGGTRASSAAPEVAGTGKGSESMFGFPAPPDLSQLYTSIKGAEDARTIAGVVCEPYRALRDKIRGNRELLRGEVDDVEEGIEQVMATGGRIIRGVVATLSSAEARLKDVDGDQLAAKRSAEDDVLCSFSSGRERIANLATAADHSKCELEACLERAAEARSDWFTHTSALVKAKRESDAASRDAVRVVAVFHSTESALRRRRVALQVATALGCTVRDISEQVVEDLKVGLVGDARGLLQLYNGALPRHDQCCKEYIDLLMHLFDAGVLCAFAEVSWKAFIYTHRRETSLEDAWQIASGAKPPAARAAMAAPLIPSKDGSRSNTFSAPPVVGTQEVEPRTGSSTEVTSELPETLAAAHSAAELRQAQAIAIEHLEKLQQEGFGIRDEQKVFAVENPVRRPRWKVGAGGGAGGERCCETCATELSEGALPTSTVVTF